MMTSSSLNAYQLDLYNQLMELVENTKSFEYKDQETEGINQRYRIFNYRMASYSDFCRPGALECRGIMYEMSDNYTEPVRLASLPMEKFFNWNENPMTMNLNLSHDNIQLVEHKVDGSLISSFLVDADDDNTDNSLCLKSKASIASVQAREALAWLNQPPQAHLKEEITRLVRELDCTINMEWVSPENRIVLPYAKDDLRILNIRSHVDGAYVNRCDLPEWVTEIVSHWTPRVEFQEEEVDSVEFVSSIPSMTGVEGFVVRLRDSGMRIKIKTGWYMALHHTKDSINSPLALYKAVLEEGTDDLKAQFYSDPLALAKISEMEQLVSTHLQELQTTVDEFCQRHSSMGRKDFAILAGREMDRDAFGLAMAKYMERPFSYKKHMESKAKVLLAKCGKTPRG